MSSPLDALFRPRSVAVVGASRDRTAISHDILHNLLRYEFQGLVFPVNPSASVVHSLKCYPTVEAIPDPVDLAIIAAPRRFVAEQVESCGRKGVKGLVIITAGFKEVGDEGAAHEVEVAAIAKRYGMRMMGPNCMGLINTDPDYRLQGTFSATTEPLAGHVAFSSQSGALGEAILALMTQLGLGLSMFASLGNKADISGNDLLEYWEDDPRTRVILMYLESFGNPQRFLQLARRVARKKPILAMKSGRTAAGARAAVSHTGSLAGTEAAVDTLFQQSGVIRCSSIEEMFVYTSALATQPIPRGNRVAIVTNSGGPGILATDTLVELGLTVAPLSDATQARIRPHVAAEASTVNPVDMIASARGPQFEVAMRAVMEDPEIDAVIAIFTSLEIIDSMAVAEGILRGAAGHGKPVLVCLMGKVSTKPAVAHIKSAGVPVYTFPEEAAHALSALWRYRQWLDRPEGTSMTFDDIDRSTIDQVCASVRADQRDLLTLVEAQRVVAAAGIPVAPWIEATSADAAVAAAGDLRGPVAIKVSSAVITHKSDAGGVRLNLTDPHEIAAVADEMLTAARASDPRATLVVQRMAPKGTETIIGATRDPKFGPLIMFGLGGVFVEVLKDVAFRLPPLTDVEADSMLDEIKGAPLLRGARGHAPADRLSLRTALLRLDALLTRYPEIDEIDMNPFMAGATAEASMAVDARIRLRAHA